MKKVFALLALLLLSYTPVWAAGSYAGNAGRWPISGDYDDKPSSVRAMQYLLKARGFNVVVDGRFGSQTEEQLWRFQTSRHIKTSVDFADADAETWEI